MPSLSQVISRFQLLWWCPIACITVIFPFYARDFAMRNGFFSNFPNVAYLYWILLLFYFLLMNISTMMSTSPPNSEDGISETFMENYVDNCNRDAFIVPSSDSTFMWSHLSTYYKNFIRFNELYSGYWNITTLGKIYICAGISAWVYRALPLPTIHENLQEDLFYASLTLVLSGTLILAVVFFIANSPKIYKEEIDVSYRPFQEEIKIPLPVIISKFIAAYLNGGFTQCLQLPIGIFCIVGGIFGWTYAQKMSGEAANSLNSLNIKYIHYSLLFIMVSAVIAGIILIFIVIKNSYKTMIESLLAVMEQNWHRNWRALQFINPAPRGRTAIEIRLMTLEDRLQNALKRASYRTRRAYGYICMPLWKSKQPFCETLSLDIGRKVTASRRIARR